MGAAGFTVAAQQDRIRGFEKDQLGRNHALYRLEDRRKLLELLALANVDYQRGAFDLRRLPDQFRETGDQPHRKVVDAVVAQVLEGFEHRCLPRAAHSGNDDEFSRRASIADYLGMARLAGGAAQFRTNSTKGHAGEMLAAPEGSRPVAG